MNRIDSESQGKSWGQFVPKPCVVPVKDNAIIKTAPYKKANKMKVIYLHLCEHITESVTLRNSCSFYRVSLHALLFVTMTTTTLHESQLLNK